MARRMDNLLRRARDFLRDVPVDATRLQEATDQLLVEARQAQEYCMTLSAAASRARLSLAAARAERERLLAAPAGEAAARLAGIDGRIEEMALALQVNDRDAQAARWSCRRIEAEAQRRLAETRDLMQEAALGRVRAAMLETLDSLGGTPGQMEHEAASEPLRDKAAWNKALGSLAANAAPPAARSDVADEPPKTQELDDTYNG